MPRPDPGRSGRGARATLAPGALQRGPDCERRPLPSRDCQWWGFAARGHGLVPFGNADSRGEDRTEGAMTSLKTLPCWAALALSALCAPAVHGQEAQGKVEIAQVDISRFPEVTVFFKVISPEGRGI